MKGRLAILLLLVTGICAFDWFVNRSTRLGYINIQETYNVKLRAELETAKNVQAKANSLKSAIDRNKPQVEEAARQLPSHSQGGVLLEQVTSLAASKGLRFDAINPKGLTHKKMTVAIDPVYGSGEVPYDEMAMTLEMGAAFRSLGRYLERLENISRFIDVVGLQIKATPRGRGVTARINIKTYTAGEK